MINVTPSEILSIPLVESTDSLPSSTPDGAKYLVGFAMNAANTMPCKNLSAGQRRMAAAGRNFAGWTEARRSRTARDVELVKHWRIIEGDYSTAPKINATFFVDPPYQIAGKHYPSQPESFVDLAEWCKSLRGQTIVCENDGANWLPFVPFCNAKSAFKSGTNNKEVVWINET